MTIQKCPVCGSEKLEKIIKTHQIPIPYGEPVDYEQCFDHCLTCGEFGDYSGENENAICQIVDLAKKRSVGSMLDDLVSKGYKLAYLERSLDLPQRTTVRWRKGEVSASSVALIRTIRTYPWILEVADSGFDPVVAKTKVCEEAFRYLHEALMPKSKEAEIALTLDQSGLNFSANYIFRPQVMIEG